LRCIDDHDRVLAMYGDALRPVLAGASNEFAELGFGVLESPSSGA
jgi:hypothetical protein